MMTNLLNFRFFFLLFLFASINGCTFSGVSKTDWIWMHMNEQQKQNALNSYYTQDDSFQPNASQETNQQPNCSEAITALREDLITLKIENACLQAKLHQNEETVIFLPPAF